MIAGVQLAKTPRFAGIFPAAAQHDLGQASIVTAAMRWQSGRGASGRAAESPGHFPGLRPM